MNIVSSASKNTPCSIRHTYATSCWWSPSCTGLLYCSASRSIPGRKVASACTGRRSRGRETSEIQRCQYEHLYYIEVMIIKCWIALTRPVLDLRPPWRLALASTEFLSAKSTMMLYASGMRVDFFLMILMYIYNYTGFCNWVGCKRRWKESWQAFLCFHLYRSASSIILLALSEHFHDVGEDARL